MSYLQLLTVPLLALAGLLLGTRIGRSRFWFLGFLFPLLFVILVFLGHRSTTLQFTPPISWSVDADFSPLLMTLAATLMLSTLIIRLPPRRRIMPQILLAVMVTYYGLLPAILPLAARASLASTPTRLDKTGACLQAHTYTCGPAAAVTCLRSLNLPAEEGPLAIESRCAPLLGTDGHLLAQAITRLYTPNGLTAQYHHFNSLDQLTTPAIATMHLPSIGGHYIAILQITPTHILTADPLSGPAALPRDYFTQYWQNTAITFTLSPSSR